MGKRVVRMQRRWQSGKTDNYLRKANMTQTEISFEAKTQNERLLEYLETHPITGITPLECWRHLEIYRLSARIFDLKKAGHNITTEICEVANKYGEKFRVACYKLVVT